MYTEPFLFTFSEELPDSERMMLLAEMFRQTEAINIKNGSYGGYKVYKNGKVKFWSYLPELTNTVVTWLKEKQNEGKLSVKKPSYAKSNHA